ncbi:hypothetical protein [Ruminiclostridium cellobioparum]|uniref:hypothetical protein n=1 Tax=Ruminiclostridium cellobioparum TaxID=29355 RepID=UPI00048306E3|nr:hypothetical protein [Ruminiclostridium cellobioparum]
MSSFLFERDLLYPTDNILDPGILHVKLLNPNNTKIPVVLEPKSNHSVVKNMDSVLDLLQKDIFDRINIRVNDNTQVYVLLDGPDREACGDTQCLKVVFMGIHEFTLEPVTGEEYSSIL